jgi:hypothetical protein
VDGDILKRRAHLKARSDGLVLLPCSIPPNGEFRRAGFGVGHVFRLLGAPERINKGRGGVSTTTEGQSDRGMFDPIKKRRP